MEIVLIALTLGLSFANGANDVSKGIATLVGSGTSKFRSAVAWGSLWTVAGGLAAAFATQGLVATFSGKGILAAPPSGTAFLTAVAVGAVAWLVLATATGLPVSTTHALTGALCGAGIAAAGVTGVSWATVARRTLIPLAVSPLLALAVVTLLVPLLAPVFRRADGLCVCLERRDVLPQMAADAASVLASASLPSVAVIAGADCPSETLVRVRALDSVHWLSSGATSFFRGLNDTPKILALGVVAATESGVPSVRFYALVACVMGLGSFVAGLRVTETLAKKVTRISPDQGLAANLATSLLVGLASRWALPVSTTHVSTGAILGSGRWTDVRWKTVRDLLLAWIVTLPVAALLAGAVYRLGW